MGKRRYFTGIPCRRGHVAERQVTNGACVKCRDWSLIPAMAAHNTGLPPTPYAFSADVTVTPELLSYVHSRVLEQVTRYAREFLSRVGDHPAAEGAESGVQARAVLDAWRRDKDAHEAALRAAGWTESMLDQARRYV